MLARQWSPVCVVTLVALCLLTPHVHSHSANPVPFGWEDMCTVTYDSNVLELYVDNVTSAGHVTHMHCVVTNESGRAWQFKQFRDHLQQIHMRRSTVFLTVDCRNGGKLSLPWPMKAAGLVGLVVSRCLLTDKYADFGDPRIAEIPEQLRVLEIKDSVWLSDDSAFDRITSPEGLSSLTSDYDCGQDSSIEYMVVSNVTDSISSLDSPLLDNSALNAFGSDMDPSVGLPSDLELLGMLQLNNDTSELSSDLILDAPNGNFNVPKDKKENDTLLSTIDTGLGGDSEFLDLLNRVMSLDIKCHYERLRVLDESLTPTLSLHHFSVMLQDAVYPKLEVLNYSRSGILQISKELKSFRTHFPSLTYLDLSHNQISEIKLPPPTNVTAGSTGKHFTLDLRHNNISHVTLAEVKGWAQLNDVIVDIRGNPIVCDAAMSEVVNTLHNTHDTDALSRYSYILELTCAGPENLRGKSLSQLHSPGSKDHSLSAATIGIICGSLALTVLVSVAVLYLVIRGRRGSHLSRLDRNSSCEKNVSGGCEKTDTGVFP